VEQQERIVIYGLGQMYEAHKEEIDAMPGIVAHCDRDAVRTGMFSDGMTVEELKTHPESYDIVYTTGANPLTMLPYLIDMLDIPVEKIRARSYEVYGGPWPHEDRQAQFYSANNEEGVLLYLLARCGKAPEDITYLEIGTNDPVRHNNSYFFYQQGAHGVLVDPLPASKRMAEIFRPRDLFVHAAVTGVPTQATVEFFESKNLEISSIHEDFQKEIPTAKRENVRERYEVPLKGVNELLAIMESSPDMVLVDAEGEDIAIVEHMDFHQYRPDILMAEVDHGDEAQLVRFLSLKGYLWYTTISGTNAIFVKKTA